MKDQGKIISILGGMFSGKSSELIRRINRYKIANRNCLLLKHKLDKDRYPSKSGFGCHTAVDCLVSDYDWVSDSDLDLVKEQILSNNIDVIGVDEGQFFTDICSFCEDLADAGKIVIVAALNGSWERKPFENISNLIALSDKSIYLNAVCVKCGKQASFSKRITHQTDLIMIGGSSEYIPVCRNCYKQA